MIGGLISTLGTLAGAIGPYLGQAFSAYGNYKQGQDQAAMSAAQLQWMKDAQYMTWSREDNATQRRVNDLRTAGLSPVLAAGAAAQTSAPVQIGTQQAAPNAFSAAGGAMTGAVGAAQQMLSMAQTKTGIDASRAQMELTKAQESQTRTNEMIQIANNPKVRDLMGSQTLSAMAAARKSNVDAAEMEKLLEAWKKTGFNIKQMPEYLRPFVMGADSGSSVALEPKVPNVGGIQSETDRLRRMREVGVLR